MASRFTWRDSKAARNLRKHHVSFEEATDVFYDEGRVELFDEKSILKTRDPIRSSVSLTERVCYLSRMYLCPATESTSSMRGLQKPNTSNFMKNTIDKTTTNDKNAAAFKLSPKARIVPKNQRLVMPTASLIEKPSSTSSVFDAYNQATEFCTHQLRSANRALHLLAEVNRGFQGIEEWMPKGKIPEAVTA